MVDTTEDQADVSGQSRPTPLGIYDRPKTEAITNIEVIAIGLTVVWLVSIAILLFVLPSGTPGADNASTDGLRSLIMLMAIVIPVGMIWVAAISARASKSMREESQRLQSAIDAMRQSYVAQNQSGGAAGNQDSVARKLDEIAAATRKAETVLATFSTRREQPVSEAVTPAPAVEQDVSQPALALGTQASDYSLPLETSDFIRALNFPETAEDQAGFAALRRAIKHRPTAQLVQAAEDILTLLSQDGIYMDDLMPDRARPEVWRHFSQGLRGRPIAALGGIRDRSSLALTAARMKQDPIFRDTAHHFLRLFDKTFADFEQQSSDGEIIAFSDTRTARAFMLLGRVAGTFD